MGRQAKTGPRTEITTISMESKLLAQARGLAKKTHANNLSALIRELLQAALGRSK